MIDLPVASQNCFIVYSRATGVHTSVLKKGIEPFIRQGITITCDTAFIEPTTKYSKKGLHITPRVSDDRKTMYMDVTITECNMTIVDYFRITVKTKGNKTTKGGSASFKFKIMCYGYDRPYMPNTFITYNCAKDKIKGRQTFMLSTINGMANTGIAELNMPRESGITFHHIAKDDNTPYIYYEGTPGTPGIYGAAVWGQTYEGGANVPGHVPNPFPNGEGTDVALFDLYKDYYKPKDTCVGLIQDVELNDSLYALFYGHMGNNGGQFKAVTKDEKWQYYIRDKVDQVSDKQQQHHEYRLSCGTIAVFGDKWYLDYRTYFNDETPPKWTRLTSTDSTILYVKVLFDGKVSTVRCILSVPTFEKWGGMSVDGDGAYFVQSRGYFHSAYLMDPKNWLDPIPVYVSKNNEFIVTQSKQVDAIIFPNYPKPTVVDFTGKTIKDAVIVTPSVTAIPYAPPALLDTAFTAILTNAVVPQALNPKPDSKLMIGNSQVAGGIWRRYPYQRLVEYDMGANTLFKISGHKDNVHTVTASTNENKGTVGRRLSFPTKDKIIHEVVSVHEIKTTKAIDSSSYLTYSGSTQLDGVISEDDTILSFCGMTTQGTASIATKKSNTIHNERTEHRDTTVSQTWRNVDTYKTVADFTVYASYGKEELSEAIVSEVSPPTKHETIETYEEQACNAPGTGAIDAYLHIGQCDTDGGRKIAQAGVHSARFQATCKKPWKRTVTVVTVEGSEGKEKSKITTNTGVIDVSMSAASHGAEVYPRISTLSSVGTAPQKPYKPKAYSKSFSIEVKSSGSLAITGISWSWNFVNEKMGDKTRVIEWVDDDGDDRRTTYSYPCYCTYGKSTMLTEVKGKRVAGSAYFSYDRTKNTATCKCTSDSLFDYTKTTDATYSVDVVDVDREDTNWGTVSNTVYKVHELHTITPKQTLEITVLENKGTHTIYKVRKTKGKTAKYESFDGKVTTYIPIEDDDVVETTMVLTPQQIKYMFESFVDKFVIDVGKVDTSRYDMYSYEAEFTDSPLYADVFNNVSEYSRTETEIADECNVSFSNK